MAFVGVDTKEGVGRSGGSPRARLDVGKVQLVGGETVEGWEVCGTGIQVRYLRKTVTGGRVGKEEEWGRRNEGGRVVVGREEYSGAGRRLRPLPCNTKENEGEGGGKKAEGRGVERRVKFGRSTVCR